MSAMDPAHHICILIESAGLSRIYPIFTPWYQGCHNPWGFSRICLPSFHPLQFAFMGLSEQAYFLSVTFSFVLQFVIYFKLWRSELAIPNPDDF